MNKKLLLTGILAFLTAISMQESNAHRMACIKVGNPPVTECATYSLSDLNCAGQGMDPKFDFANFAYVTSDWYKCFVKFDPEMITTKAGVSNDTNAFKNGTGTSRQNCGFIYLNSNSVISADNLKKINQSISPQTFLLPANSPLRAKLSKAQLAAALGNPSQLTIDYCLKEGSTAIVDAKNFLGHALVDTSASLALTVQQQMQQQAAAKVQQQTTTQTAMQKLCANPSPAYKAYCASQGYSSAAVVPIAPVVAPAKPAQIVKPKILALTSQQKLLQQKCGCINGSDPKCVSTDGSYTCANDDSVCAYKDCADGESCSDANGKGCPK